MFGRSPKLGLGLYGRRPWLKRARATFHLYKKLFLVFIFILISIFTLGLSYANIPFATKVRVFLTDMTTPIMSVASIPYDITISTKNKIYKWVNTYYILDKLEEENTSLKRQLNRLKSLEEENKKLRQLTHMVPDRFRTYITARIVAYPGRPFVKSILLNAGSKDGVESQQPVVTDNGLVGRTIDVGMHSSRILLITDLNSRVPVIIEGLNEHAILAGDNTDYPKLKYVKQISKVKIGDIIRTSGRGGVFSSSIPVGIISKIENDVIKVQPYVDLESLTHVTLVTPLVDHRLIKAE